MANGKYTLLQIVQKTMEALNLDQVNSISDSPDSEQVAQIAQDSYYELLNQKEWPHLNKLRQLESVADADYPNYLRIPDTVVRIDQFKYDKTELLGDTPELIKLENVGWLKPEDFLDYTQTRNTEQDNVVPQTDFNGVRYLILNDTFPQYWTSFDDEYVVTDAVDLGEESTLQALRSQVLVKEIPNFVIADDTVADAPAHFFQTWLAEVRSTAKLDFQQEVSPKDEQKARRGLAVLRRNAYRTSEEDGKVRYGRRPNRWYV